MPDVPEHIVVEDGDIVTVGVGFTVTVTDWGAPPQPLVVSFTV